MARRCPAQSRRHASRDKAPRASATTFLGLPSILPGPVETIRQREEDGYRQVKDWPFRPYDGAGLFGGQNAGGLYLAERTVRLASRSRISEGYDRCRNRLLARDA